MRSKVTRLILAAAVVAVLVVGAACDSRVRSLRERFEGPTTTIAPGEDAFFPRCVYQPVEGREASGEVDVITKATVAIRLGSPSVYRERRPSRRLRITYPPDGAVFPANLCAPFVEWDDAVNDLWLVRITVDRAGHPWEVLSRRRRLRVPRELWETLRGQTAHRDAVIQVLGVRQGGPPGQVHASTPVHVRVSADPTDECIVYRLVSPPFAPQSTPDTFVRHVGSMRTRPFLLGRGQYCFNCHMFSSPHGARGKLSIQSRYMSPGNEPLKIYLGIYDLERQQGWRVKLPFPIQMSTFTSWSPDATKLALSANQQLGTIPPVVFETQRVAMPTSDIAIYDVSREEAYLLPGASRADRLEAYPRWTPDGQSLVFASAPAQDAAAERILFGLQVVPFQGGRGGDAHDIPGAAANGKSNYFPRFSPDGKWLSFCQSNGGTLIKSSSDVWLAPADLQGRPRRLECNTPYAADSWHSWSSNGRWLVFASKRDDGIYARLYFTHIDAEGRASPAVRLPLERPPMASFNIPESVARWPRVTDRTLYAAIRVETPPRTVKAIEAK